MKAVRMSTAKVKVLEALLASPGEPQYGYGIMRATGVKSGALYPILDQLERAGWVKARWEDITEETHGRPPRRWYELTGAGRAAAPRAIDEFSIRRGRPSMALGGFA
jgi:DNA-binding PadR family transcriptional regulator